MGKPERPEKIHDFRQSVDRLFSHESVARIEPTILEVKGACSDDCATEATLTTEAAELTLLTLSQQAIFSATSDILIELFYNVNISARIHPPLKQITPLKS